MTSRPYEIGKSINFKKSSVFKAKKAYKNNKS